MKRQITNEVGITLVALTVTIIILLIISGVSITVLTQTNLFTNARKAKSIAENVQIDENTTLTKYENQIIEITGNRDTVTIDKGSSSGIKKDMAVVTKNGFVGKIHKVSENSSEVKLITADDVNYKVSVSITTSSGDTNAILNGYDKKSGLLKVVGVDKTSDVKEGDVILTSGLGGKEPRGIYIGVVNGIKTDKYNLSKTLYLKTGQDFSNIHYLTVLKEKIS